MRRIIAALISRDSGIEVVRAYANAKFAITLINKLQPDLIILDIEMPEMDGLTALVEIRKKYQFTCYYVQLINEKRQKPR